MGMSTGYSAEQCCLSFALLPPNFRSDREELWGAATVSAFDDVQRPTWAENSTQRLRLNPEDSNKLEQIETMTR